MSGRCIGEPCLRETLNDLVIASLEPPGSQLSKRSVCKERGMETGGDNRLVNDGAAPAELIEFPTVSTTHGELADPQMADLDLQHYHQVLLQPALPFPGRLDAHLPRKMQSFDRAGRVAGLLIFLGACLRTGQQQGDQLVKPI